MSLILLFCVAMLVHQNLHSTALPHPRYVSAYLHCHSVVFTQQSMLVSADYAVMLYLYHSEGQCCTTIEHSSHRQILPHYYCALLIVLYLCNTQPMLYLRNTYNNHIVLYLCNTLARSNSVVFLQQY